MSASPTSPVPPVIETAQGALTRPDLAKALSRIALEAGAVIMPFFKGEAAVREKEDSSPVTDADEAAETLILKALAALTPDIPVIAEEAVAAGHIPAIGDTFFLVDPLDGTKEFISGRGEFTVNIALVEQGLPTAGVVLAPAMNRMFYGASPDSAFEEAVTAAADGTLTGADPKPIAARPEPAGGLIAVASRSHRDEQTDKYLENFNIESFKSAGSSLKFCLVATGEADIYPRHGRTMEWDTAAGHAVLAAAGGTVTTFDGAPLHYGKTEDGFANPYFVARGRTA